MKPGVRRDRDRIATLKGHKYLKLLEHGAANPTFPKSYISQYLNLSDDEINGLLKAGAIQQSYEGPSDQNYYRIGFDAYVNYLEFIELEQAYRSSRQASKIAISAVVISGVLALISIGLNVAEILIT
jgi:hypothetical protein